MENVEKEIIEIRALVEEGVSKKTIAVRYPNMASKEHLFDMLTEKDMDQEILTALIVLREGVASNNMTDNDASIMFGELLVNKYIKGVVPENA